jgi:hypothetical protein
VSDSLSDRLSEAVRTVLTAPPSPCDEADFQDRLAAALGTRDIELRMVFDPPAFAPRPPGADAVAACAAKGRSLDNTGRDPCSGSLRKLDALWHVEGQHVPVELKLVNVRKSDVYSYDVLNDIHRLERLRSAGGLEDLADVRFVVFASREPAYWTDAPPEPEPFRLFDGRATPARHWVQYNQKSPVTLWHKYPPFHLANPYVFKWRDAGWFGRFLLVSVRRQQC